MTHRADARPRRLARTLLAALALACAAAPSVAFGAPKSAKGTVHALVINGGDRPASNYLSHLQHVQDMRSLLGRRGIAPERIHIFSADGTDAGADLASRDLKAADFWLLDGTELGNRLRPRVQLTSTPWTDARVRPARLDALREWFAAAQDTLAPGDTLLVFVTDHGTKGKNGPEENAISLWQEKLTVADFRALLALLRPGVRVVMVMSQCYSGAFARLMSSDAGSDPSGEVCGFFSTNADERAYGCYPEGSDRDRIGHAFEFIAALERRATTARAHTDVLVSDATPDRPLRTSDLYLARLVSDEAVRRGVPADDAADVLLAEAWRNAAAWEPSIRLLDDIGQAFGTFSPRGLGELKAREEELEAVSDPMRLYAGRWKNAASEVKALVLRRFLDAHRDWRDRVDADTLKALDASTRAALLENLLAELAPFARAQQDLWLRLERYQSYATRGEEAEWRLDVRRAAADRMRTILLGVAGRVLLARQEQERRTRDGVKTPLPARLALDRLERCEAFEPGRLPAPAPITTENTPRTPYPSIATEIALLQELQPSWLGVRFREVPAEVRARLDLPAGAVQLQDVNDGSPAEKAGLEAGDFVLGPPGEPFTFPRHIAEWTMTSPRDTPLPLVAYRPGSDGGEGRRLDVAVSLVPQRFERAALVEPPALGSPAPALPDTLRPVRAEAMPDLRGRPHLLFFWATWCGPCKRAVPDVLAFSEASGIPVLAISDEDPDVVATFLERRREPFFDAVAIDPRRRTFRSHGVSGTPTIVSIDAQGVVRHRQVGFDRNLRGILDGWQ